MSLLAYRPKVIRLGREIRSLASETLMAHARITARRLARHSAGGWHLRSARSMHRAAANAT
jgi:hypothetical protein